MSVHPDGDTKRPGKTKVSNLDDTLVIDKQVLGLQVTVQNTALVAEQDALEQLKVER